MTLYQMKENLSTLHKEIASVNDIIVKSAADPNIPVEDITKAQTRMKDLKTRYDTLKAAHDECEQQEIAQIKKQAADDPGQDPKKSRDVAKGEFYKAVLTGGDVESVTRKAYSHLGAVPTANADLGYGDNLLPRNMANELIVEPFQDNPMRAVVRVSNITGLEEPRLVFEIDDDDYNDITDKDTAKEIELKGESVEYGRHKVKVKARVSDTVLRGSPYNLSGTIDNALRSGLAANEMRRMFAVSPSTDYAGMSFYSTANGVKVVTGSNKQAAIAAALADLPLAFRRNAKIAMSSVDWFGMWGANLNQSGMFYEDRPLQLFGKEVILVDDATDPVVGDLSYARINYDIGTTYDTDKDVDAGIYKFVLTAWYDIKLRLSSAFRIARVNP